ncbi:hypothetical protein TcCL_NonESM09300 [Trypanosoma cruzi]|nr:hypothetical protein TcCL_NonESM09300 [Trypanosoma cruzi]
MQQKNVPYNIFRCPAFHLNSHACHGGGACVTSGMNPKYQAACRGEWMLYKRARVIAQHKMTSKRKTIRDSSYPCVAVLKQTLRHMWSEVKEKKKEEMVK